MKEQKIIFTNKKYLYIAILVSFIFIQMFLKSMEIINTRIYDNPSIIKLLTSFYIILPCIILDLILLINIRKTYFISENYLKQGKNIIYWNAINNVNLLNKRYLKLKDKDNVCISIDLKKTVFNKSKFNLLINQIDNNIKVNKKDISNIIDNYKISKLYQYILQNYESLKKLIFLLLIVNTFIIGKEIIEKYDAYLFSNPILLSLLLICFVIILSNSIIIFNLLTNKNYIKHLNINIMLNLIYYIIYLLFNKVEIISFIFLSLQAVLIMLIVLDFINSILKLGIEEKSDDC